MASLPGLNGTGFTMVNAIVCEEELAGRGPAFAAKVNIMFRPRPAAAALVFATIIFWAACFPTNRTRIMKLWRPKIAA